MTTSFRNPGRRTGPTPSTHDAFRLARWVNHNNVKGAKFENVGLRRLAPLRTMSFLIYDEAVNDDGEVRQVLQLMGRT